MIRFLIAVGVATASLFWTGTAQAGKLLVVSKVENSLAWYDTETGKQLGKATPGRGGAQVAVTPDGKTAFVSDFTDLDNTVSVFDVASMKLTGKIKIPSVWGPHGMDITRDGELLYVTCEKNGAIAVIDISAGKVINIFRTNMKGPHMLNLSPDDKWLFVANLYAGNISIFDTATGELERHVLTGRRPEGMDVSPDGKELWVAGMAVHEMRVIDLTTRTVKDKFPCEGSPVRVRFTPDGKRVLVTCFQVHTVRVFDAETRTLVGTINTGHTPHAIEMDPSGKRAFISNGGSNTVSVIDLETLEKTNEFEVLEVPVALAYVE
jgi:YVTN family beta-propeller protein